MVLSFDSDNNDFARGQAQVLWTKSHLKKETEN